MFSLGRLQDGHHRTSGIGRYLPRMHSSNLSGMPFGFFHRGHDGSHDAYTVGHTNTPNMKMTKNVRNHEARKASRLGKRFREFAVSRSFATPVDLNSAAYSLTAGPGLVSS